MNSVAFNWLQSFAGARPALWFHGGNLMQSRHYSLYLALQLKARMEGLPTPVRWW